MQEEIKEILDKLQKVANRETASRNALMEMKDKDYQLLLDYITNLQEKVDQYENPEDMTLFYMWLDEKAKDKMKELQEENERLKEKIDTLKSNFEVEIDDCEDYKKWYRDYKSRNEKIINKISLYRMDDITMETNRILDDLLNTARGVDKE